MKIEYVHPLNIKPVWPKVREGLEKIIALCTETWLPEDVYFACKSDKASLFVFEQGFFVVEILTDAFDGSKKLNVWCLYTQPDQDDTTRWQIIQQLDTIAANAGCKAVRFVSPRTGWGRYLEGDFTEKSRVYERPLG